MLLVILKVKKIVGTNNNRKIANQKELRVEKVSYMLMERIR